MIDDDNTACSKQPGTFCSHDSDWSCAKNHNSVARLNTTHFCCLITCRNDICKQYGIIRIHPFRNYNGANIGIRNTYIFGLTAIITTSSMRISKNTAYSSSLRIRFMTVAVQFLTAKSTFPAGNIKRNHNTVTNFYFFNSGSYFNNFSNKFMSKC